MAGQSIYALRNENKKLREEYDILLDASNQTIHELCSTCEGFRIQKDHLEELNRDLECEIQELKEKIATLEGWYDGG